MSGTGGALTQAVVRGRAASRSSTRAHFMARSLAPRLRRVHCFTLLPRLWIISRGAVPCGPLMVEL